MIPLAFCKKYDTIKSHTIEPNFKRYFYENIIGKTTKDQLLSEDPGGFIRRSGYRTQRLCGERFLYGRQQGVHVFHDPVQSADGGDLPCGSLPADEKKDGVIQVVSGEVYRNGIHYADGHRVCFCTGPYPGCSGLEFPEHPDPCGGPPWVRH